MRPPTDWKLLAEARGLHLPEPALAALEALESQFRPLIETIPHDIEPALTLSDAAVSVLPDRVQ